MVDSPEPGHQVIDLDGKPWEVYSAWSSTLLVKRYGSPERAIRDDSFDQLFQTSPTSWAMLPVEELPRVRRQRKAISKLRRLVREDSRVADETYESKYEDVVDRAIYDALKEEILRELAEEKRQKELEERRQRERFERERKRREREERQALIESKLSEALIESLTKADELNHEINDQGLVDYPKMREKYLKDWLAEHFESQQISDEQVAAIGNGAKSFLLRARAGSGKTRVIANKAAVMMGHEGVSPDQLMILAFNRKAAKEATDRVRNELGIIDFNNARTFHSLAYQLVQPRRELLFDQNTGSTRKQSQFVQGLLNSVLNPAIMAQIYFFYRQEMRELEDIGTFMSDADYYTYRRNHVQETLGGQFVKSKGEKWIADFLFEHGIRYAYEAIWYWDQGNEGNYQPDFSLVTMGNRYDIVIEHWGIDLNDPHQRVPDYWDKSWQEYRQQIDQKRDYWKRFNAKNPDQQVRFLETSISDLRDDREAFEEHFAAMLEQAGVRLRRLSEKELHEKVVRARIGRFSTMCLQYIQKAKKQRLDPEKMARKIAAQNDLDARTQAFLGVANNLYRRYREKLYTADLIDFDDLMELAIGRVNESKGGCQVRIQDDRYVAMNELRWIMIDEYQDFSQLFYDLIDALRTHNPSVKLFCVGDDWQAINAFAGSDLRYFNDFQSWNEAGEVGDLQNNYRSAPQIVAAGNCFMEGKGKESFATRRDLAGKVEICATDKVWIEQRSGAEYAQDRESDQRFETWIQGVNGKRKVDSGMRIGRMLKQCHTILTRPNYDTKTKFAILSRVERLGTAYPDLNAFKRKLKSTLTKDQLKEFGDFDSRVHCGTVHSFKGLEAGVVIVLGANKRNFPKIHPDNELFSIFGVTPEDVLAEEERLFYVAITRAEKELYLLTESRRESEFLGRLGLSGSGVRSAKYGSTGSRSDWSDDFDDDIPF